MGAEQPRRYFYRDYSRRAHRRLQDRATTECTFQHALSNRPPRHREQLPSARENGRPHWRSLNITRGPPLWSHPKKSKPGKWRLIIDLSAPEDHSVNDGIDKALCSISYVKIDEVANYVLSFPPGALMAKIDIKHAYRNIPVHPDDRHLLAMRWQDEILVDKVLPFGLRSAPIIFTAVADALQWIIQNKGASSLFHYLDDYITVGPPNSPQCSRNLEIIKQTCQELGVPLEESKSEGPTACLTFLGLELDSATRIIRLPQDKLARLRQSLSDWGSRKAVQKRELLSLIGHLQHAAKVVRQGRSFLRRPIHGSQPLTAVRPLEHWRSI